MKRTRNLLALALAAAVAGVLVLTLDAQPGSRPGGGPRYDPATELTFDGEVEAVETAEGGRGWRGVHLVVRAGDDRHTVHLGPSWYLEDEGFAFAAGNAVRVLGSRVTVDEEPVVIARQVTIGGKTLTLRGEDGRPSWAGRGRP